MTNNETREKCYKCYRPKSSCMCMHINQVNTNTKFVILMHPKEFKKVKNGTGFLTHLSLENSELFIGIDFTNHDRVNEIIKTHNSFVLYPSDDAINISKQNPQDNENADKSMAIFVIDSTWSCSKSMLRESINLKSLKFISFDSTKLSQFEIKKQPETYCLSTIESTLCVLENLNSLNIENITKNNINIFLHPFFEMIKYQKKIIETKSSLNVRFKAK